MFNIGFGLSGKVLVSDAILVTMTPTALFTVGINLTFASGTLTIDWKDGSGTENFVSDVELTHEYTDAGTNIAEISGNLVNITKFIADNSRITLITGLKTGLLDTFDISFNLYSGVLDLTNAPLGNLFFIRENTSFTSIIFAPTGNSPISSNMTNSNIIGSSTMIAVKDQLFFSGNPLMTALSFAATGNLPIATVNMEIMALTSLDMSMLQVGSTSLEITNSSGLIDISFSSSGNSLKDARLFINSLGYSDFTGFTFAGNSFVLNYNVNPATAADVNQMLSELYDLVSGEGGGGDFVSRTVHMGGAGMAAPDGSSGGFDGLTAKTNLQGKGITVNTN